MKKALLSLLLVAAFMPFAFAQDNAQRAIIPTNANACESYTWSVNNQTYTSDTIVTYVNTTDDTLFVLSLTINTPFNSIQTILSNRCSYNWRGNTYTASGNYSDTVVAASNSGLCDSIFNLHLTVSNMETETTTQNACGSYTWHGNTYSTSGTYTDTNRSNSNCTHIDVLNLNIVTSIITSEDVAHCGDYTWYDTTYTTAGTYTHTISDPSANCDTIHTLNLTIVFDSASMTYDSACATKTWRGNTYTTSGVYFVLDTNASNHCVTYHPITLNIKAPRTNTYDTALTGCNSILYRIGTTNRIFKESMAWDTLLTNRRWDRCYDSTISFNLTVNKSNYDTSWVNSCDSFYWDQSKRNYYTTPTSYPHVSSGVDSLGCDSVHVLALTIYRSPVIASINGEWHLNAGDTAVLYPTCTNGATYKWTYGNSQSTADTLRIPNVQGNIDVSLEATLKFDNNQFRCFDTSWITIVTFVGLNDVPTTRVSIYPNPTVGQINIQSDENVREAVIFNAVGQQVSTHHNLGNQSILNLSNLSKGTYTMRLTLQNNETITRKLIISK